LYPLYIIFFIAAVAETNRAPFDLAEAESELVSGFMTEHSAAIFVFFFLAEYASIILMCILISITLLGGYEIFSIIYFLQQNLSNIVIIIIEIIKFLTNIDLNYENNLYSDVFLYYLNNIINNNIYFSVLNAIILSIKSLLLIFAFI
jgi:NADH-ubiquinone oxidoreductase chain 1